LNKIGQSIAIKPMGYMLLMIPFDVRASTNHSKRCQPRNLYEALLKCNKAYYLSKGMSSDRRENPEQIPSSHNEGQTEAMVSEQARIEAKEKK